MGSRFGALTSTTKVKNAPFLVEAVQSAETAAAGAQSADRPDAVPPSEATLCQAFQGWVSISSTPKVHPWQQVSPIFEDSRLLVFPSLVWEAWGLVCNEAMQCGVPALASTFTRRIQMTSCAPAKHASSCHLIHRVWAGEVIDRLAER